MNVLKPVYMLGTIPGTVDSYMVGTTPRRHCTDLRGPRHKTIEQPGMLMILLKTKVYPWVQFQPAMQIVPCCRYWLEISRIGP